MGTRALILLALATLVAPAQAGEWPVAFGVADRGSFKLVANVRLEARGGEMKGVWIDGKAGCLDRRPLRVAIDIDLVSPAGKTTRVKRSRQGRVDNCAEGGPNYGFDLVPRKLGLGCSNGRWRPGRYTMTTRVTDVRSGLVAHASLYHHVAAGCPR